MVLDSNITFQRIAKGIIQAPHIKSPESMTASSKLLDLSTAERESLGLIHTLREILQQPQTWRRTFERVQSSSGPIAEFLEGVGIGAKPVNVFLVGAGTSDYIGKCVCALLQKSWRCNVQSVPSTDLLTNMEDHVIPDRDYLWISFSRSGDSSEGVGVLEQALTLVPRVKHLIITCNRNGKMARSFESQNNVLSFVLDDEVNDRGLAMTSSFSNMVIAAQALAHLQTFVTYGAIVESLARSASLLLPVAMSVCERIVEQGFSKVCFLGAGPLKGVAIESALKVLELTGGRVIGFGESFLGLRHGPLSAGDGDTLVVAFLSADSRRRAFELDLLREIQDKKLTGNFLIVAPTQVETPFTDMLNLQLSESISDLYLPPLFVLAGQLLGMFASLREGLRPDEPSPRGAIS